MARKRPSIRFTIIGIVAIFAIILFVLPPINRLIEAPWAIGYGGRDTLTGAWAGTMQARQGANYALYLDLDYRERSSGRRRSRSSSGANRSNLEGKATLCTPTGDRYDYEVSGRANRSGKVEALWLEYGDPKLSALNLNLSGPWQKPVLVLRASRNPFLPDGSFVFPRAVSSDDPDDSLAPVTLRKQSRKDFEALCAQVKR